MKIGWVIKNKDGFLQKGCTNIFGELDNAEIFNDEDREDGVFLEKGEKLVCIDGEVREVSSKTSKNSAKRPRKPQKKQTPFRSTPKAR